MPSALPSAWQTCAGRRHPDPAAMHPASQEPRARCLRLARARPEARETRRRPWCGWGHPRGLSKPRAPLKLAVPHAYALVFPQLRMRAAPRLSIRRLCSCISSGGPCSVSSKALIYSSKATQSSDKRPQRWNEARRAPRTRAPALVLRYTDGRPPGAGELAISMGNAQ